MATGDIIIAAQRAMNKYYIERRGRKK